MQGWPEFDLRLCPVWKCNNIPPNRAPWSPQPGRLESGKPETVPGLPWLHRDTFHEYSRLGSHHGRQGLRTQKQSERAAG